MSIIKTFKDSLNNIVYPATHAKAVFVEKGNTHTDLQNYLETEQGGHTILDNSGTSMTQQPNLQFSGLNVTNDGTNSKTVVKSPIFNGTTAQWTALSSAEKAKYTVVNISDDYANSEVVLWDSGEKSSSDWTDDATNNRYLISLYQTNAIAEAVINGANTYGRNSIYIVIFLETPSSISSFKLAAYIPSVLSSGKYDQIIGVAPIGGDTAIQLSFPLAARNSSVIYMLLTGDARATYVQYKWRFKIIAIS